VRHTSIRVCIFVCVYMYGDRGLPIDVLFGSFYQFVWR